MWALEATKPDCWKIQILRTSIYQTAKIQDCRDYVAIKLQADRITRITWTACWKTLHNTWTSYYMIDNLGLNSLVAPRGPANFLVMVVKY